MTMVGATTDALDITYPTTNEHKATLTSQTSSPSALAQQKEIATRVIASFRESGGGNDAASPKTFTDGENPQYNPSRPAQLGSSNPLIAANGVLRLERLEGATPQPQGDAQNSIGIIAAHKNDPQFLSQFFGALGPKRTASILSYMASFQDAPVASSTPGTATSVPQLEAQYQDVADALSTLVKSGNFNKADMDQFVSNFASVAPHNSLFPNDLLSKASPQVNQLFFQSAKDYALNNQNSSAGQSMAAYAMQALSQTSNPMATLQQTPQLASLVTAATIGTASYGNPPSLNQFVQSGGKQIAPSGEGRPLVGLTNLMSQASGSGMPQSVQSEMFRGTCDALSSGSAAQSFVRGNAGMKEALNADFQQSQHAILSYPGTGNPPTGAWSEPNSALTQEATLGLKQFFANAVFSMPPASNAKGSMNLILGQISDLTKTANALPHSGSAPGQIQSQAFILGQEAEAMSAGMQQQFSSILASSANAHQETNALLNFLATPALAGIGAASPELAIGAAVVGEALNLLTGARSGGDVAAVEAAQRDLQKHGINVNAANTGGLDYLEGKMKNRLVATQFDVGLSHARNDIYPVT